MPSSPVDHVPLVEVVRGGQLEGVHFGSVAVCDTAGRLLLGRGTPQAPTYLRSSAKPFQAVTVIQSGTAARFRLTDQEIALCCASHGAQPFQLQVVESILHKCHLTAEALQCGPHAPNHAPSAEALAREGRKPERIHNNCSGKHAGMLAVCRHKGWPIESYLQMDHPLQQENRRIMAAFAGAQPEQIPVGVDGCGVPTFYVPLCQIAIAFARLANPDLLSKEVGDAAKLVAGAMMNNPVHVAYEGNFGAILLQRLAGRVVGKGGAEGVFGLGLAGAGIGIACKISDGASRAIAPVVVSLLAQFMPQYDLTDLKEATVKPITNTRGEVVGEFRVTK